MILQHKCGPRRGKVSMRMKGATPPPTRFTGWVMFGLRAGFGLNFKINFFSNRLPRFISLIIVFLIIISTYLTL